MMNKKLLTLVATAAVVLFGLAIGTYAGSDVADEIVMKNKAYKKHKKGIVTFTHKKHQDDYAIKYPKLYKRGCGECHHDENNKPLSSLKAGDPVQNCIECHKKPGEVPGKLKKEWKAKKVKRAKQKILKLEYHAEALHYNCRGCHKAYKKATKKKNAPTTCVKCHPKKPKS